MNPAIVVLFSCMAVMVRGAVIVDPTRAALGLYGGAPRPIGIGGVFETSAWPFSVFGSSRAVFGGGVLRSSAIEGLGFGAEPLSAIGAGAAIAMDAGALSPVGIEKLGVGVGPFDVFGDSRAVLGGGALRPSAIGGVGFGAEQLNGIGAGCIGGECANIWAENQVRQVEVQKQLQDQLELQNVQFIQQQQLLNEQKRLQQQRILSGEAALTQQAVEGEAQLEEQRAFVDVSQRLQRAQLLEQMKTAQINLAASKGLWNPIKKICTVEGCFVAPTSFMSPLVAGVF